MLILTLRLLSYVSGNWFCLLSTDHLNITNQNDLSLTELFPFLHFPEATHFLTVIAPKFALNPLVTTSKVH